MTQFEKYMVHDLLNLQKKNKHSSSLVHSRVAKMEGVKKEATESTTFLQLDIPRLYFSYNICQGDIEITFM